MDLPRRIKLKDGVDDCPACGKLLILLAVGLTASVLINLIMARDLAESRRMHTELIDSASQQGTGGMEGPVVEPPPAPAGTYVFPVAVEDYREKTSPFGTRISPLTGIERTHYGLDISAVWRAEIVSVADGVIIDHYPPPGYVDESGVVYRGHYIYGGYVEILHDTGAVSRYGHLHSTRAMIGRRVRAGTPIGRQGATGMATGDHLHFELLIEGEHVNPLLYLPDVRR